MSKKAIFQIQVQPIGKRVPVSANTTIFEAVREAGIDLASSCGGTGSCGLCRIALLEGDTNPWTIEEGKLLDEIERLNGLRLACQIKVTGDISIQIPRDSLIIGQHLQIESDLPGTSVDPIVRAYHLELQPPTLEDVRSDLTRITDTLDQRHGLSGLRAGSEVIRILPATLRENRWRITIFIRDREIVGLGPYNSRPLGFAVDLGTTKIAAYLVDLETGQDLVATGVPNPQIGYGEDVISRLSYVLRNPDGGQTLAEKVRQTLNGILGELVRKIGVSPQQVVDACIVGNTAMTHLLLKFPVRQLARSPYVAAVNTSLDVRANELGLEIAPGAYVHIPPCIGGFVGADHVAMVIASALDQSDKVTLGIDIGTNTEIVLCKPGTGFLTAASCPSGPAFEGAHIGDGMRAASGAIERVRLTEDSVELETIDGAPAVGLCGSGIIDAIAELYRVGLINNRGRFQKDKPRVDSGHNGAEFLLAAATGGGNGRDVVITQKDVNEIQLAKGAIYTGIEILLEMTDTAPEEVEEVVIAGAFGSLLDVSNALAIGLFPGLPQARYSQVGNAAAIGAKWMLISRQARLQAQNLAANMKYYELTTYPKFGRRFALGMLFPQQIA